MKQLYLLRHAKSSWDEPGLADFDRPLSSRGKRACEALRETLRRYRAAPDLILCSSTRRTQDTLRRIGPAFTRDHTVAIERDLYLASARKLLDRLRRVDDAIESVMIIGHNPGLQRLAVLLTGAGDPDLRARLEEKFPTAAVAHLGFPATSWRALMANSGEILRFVTQRGNDTDAD